MGNRRQTPEVIAWRKVVYARDDWKCQWPGCNLGPRTFPFRRIEAHHIKPWSRHPELRLVINNGITLCTEHHNHVTDREERFILFFQRLLRKRKKTWTPKKEKFAKARMLKHVLKTRFRSHARSAGRRRRRGRS